MYIYIYIYICIYMYMYMCDKLLKGLDFGLPFLKPYRRNPNIACGKRDRSVFRAWVCSGLYIVGEWAYRGVLYSDSSVRDQDAVGSVNKT